MTLQATLQQIYDLPFSAYLRESGNGFPTVESLHVIAISIVFGTIMIVDLRLLGVGSHRRSARRLIAETLPYTWVAFGVAVTTGSMLFMSNAISYPGNPQFLIKMLAIPVAGLNMAVFHSTAYRNIDLWDQDAQPPLGARVAGALSLLTWITVIALGRWIGFTLETVL